MFNIKPKFILGPLKAKNISRWLLKDALDMDTAWLGYWFFKCCINSHIYIHLLIHEPTHSSVNDHSSFWKTRIQFRMYTIQNKQICWIWESTIHIKLYSISIFAKHIFLLWHLAAYKMTPYISLIHICNNWLNKNTRIMKHELNQSHANNMINLCLEYKRCELKHSHSHITNGDGTFCPSNLDKWKIRT